MTDTIGLIKGTYQASTNTVRGFLPQDSVARRITGIALDGPRRSTFRLYRGTSAIPANLITSTNDQQGGSNDYDTDTQGAAKLIPAASDCLAVWSGGDITATSTATATVRMVF